MVNDNKCNLVIFTDRYPYGKGEAFFETELTFLAKNFKEIIIYPLDSEANANKRPAPVNVKVLTPVYHNFKNKASFILKGIVNISPIWPYLIEFFSGKCWTSPKKTWDFISYTLLTRALVCSFKKEYNTFKDASVYYFYWGLRWSQILPFALKKPTSKIVVRFHGSDLYEYTNNHYIPYRVKQLMQIDLAVFISEIGKQYMVERYPFIKDKSYVGRLGTKDFGLNPWNENGVVHIVSCSNLVHLKRVHLIVQSLSFIAMPIKWTHIGDGPLKNEINQLIQHLPSHVETHLLGALDHDHLVKFYLSNAVSLFLNVSSSEGIPVAVMEALSFGIPVLATNVGGTSEIVDEKVGCLLDAALTPEVLAAKIAQTIEKPNYHILRDNSRKRWESACMADNVYPYFVAKIKDAGN